MNSSNFGQPLTWRDPFLMTCNRTVKWPKFTSPICSPYFLFEFCHNIRFVASHWSNTTCSYADSDSDPCQRSNDRIKIFSRCCAASSDSISAMDEFSSTTRMKLVSCATSAMSVLSHQLQAKMQHTLYSFIVTNVFTPGTHATYWLP